MRTTIRIDDALYRRAKALAARTGRTVSDVIEDAIRRSLQPLPATERDAPGLPTYGGSGLMPGVELSDNARLRDLLDEGQALDALR